MSAEWYYTTNQQQMGPVSWDELRQLARSGLLKPNDMVWSDGMAEWVKASRQNGLFAEAAGVAPARRSQADIAPPPVSRRGSTRQGIDDELDEQEHEDRRARRRARSEGSGNGWKIGLAIGAVVVLLLV